MKSVLVCVRLNVFVFSVQQCTDDTMWTRKNLTPLSRLSLGCKP